MKSFKKITAILLGFAILTTMFILPAAAADGSGTAADQPVFLTDGNMLLGIDFSGMIRDETTIHAGRLVLLNELGDPCRYAQFAVQQNHAAVFGIHDDETGEFAAMPLHAQPVDYTYCLRPENEQEKLFDDVDAFTFTMHDIIEQIAQAEIKMYAPALKVLKADGDRVTEMALDFSTARSDAPMIFDSVDFSKTLTFTVRLFGILQITTITLQPTAYDAATGILTVSVQDKNGQEGCTLFDFGATIEGSLLTTYLYHLQVPAGMFFSSRNEKIRSAEIACSSSLSSIEGLSVRIAAAIEFPSWLLKLGEKAAKNIHSAHESIPFLIFIGVPILLSQFFPLMHLDAALFRSLKDYGVRFPLLAVLRAVLRLL
jgi:hypothetical protein